MWSFGFPSATSSYTLLRADAGPADRVASSKKKSSKILFKIECESLVPQCEPKRANKCASDVKRCKVELRVEFVREMSRMCVVARVQRAVLCKSQIFQKFHANSIFHEEF